jgi:hypothetical protein
VLTATLKAAFPHVWRDLAKPTNTQLAASVSPPSPARVPAVAPPPLRALATAVASRLGPGLAGGEVYTDDRAPVEWLIDRSIVTVARNGG